MTKNPNLFEAAESAARMVLNGHLDQWREGAIFPSEMAFFLARCDSAGIERVIESGRQDGYSTAILGEWAAANGREVASIDLEHDPERAAACRERLKRWPVQLIKGSAYTEFGRLAGSGIAKPTAFLVDGPKGWPAISMMSGATTPNVKLVALHNLASGYDTRGTFLALGGPSIFYEVALANGGPVWQLLLRKERELLTELGAARDLDCSSLGVLSLDGDARESFMRLSGSRFGLHQPKLVRAFYRSRLYVATTKLYGLSYRLLGR